MDENFDLRVLRTVLAVGEELHFGRAAERLGLSQAAASAHVRRLEEELGVALFARTSRRVAVTPAGEAFLAGAGQLLRLAETTVASARRADRGQDGHLVVGVAPAVDAGLLRRVVDEFLATRPGVTADLRQSPFTDPSGGLADGSVDVALVRPPLGTSGVVLEVVAEEPRAAIVPAGHALAAKDELDIEDLLDEPWAYAETDPVWRAFWTAEAERGAPARYGISVQSLDGLLNAVGAGLAVALVPASLQQALSYRDVEFRPVRGLASAQLAVGWAPGGDHALVRAFVATAKRLRRHGSS